MGTIATPLLIAFVIPLALAGCVSSEDENQKTKKIAEKVKRQAELSEKAEGSQDLVKDEVTVRKGEKGQPIIEQVGEASSYGPGFHGKKTATGEKFNQNDRTAAHPTLPMGTQATVTNLKTGNSVDVKINDRGPYVKGRDIDLSKRAAKELGITKEGVAAVKIEAEMADEIPDSSRTKRLSSPQD